MKGQIREWESCPVITIYRPACPHCKSIDYAKVRSESNGDGSQTRKVVCRSCGRKYKIVVELLPESGNGDSPTL